LQAHLAAADIDLQRALADVEGAKGSEGQRALLEQQPRRARGRVARYAVY
jgi:hypothetical protein